jgi:hypothetical protein
MKHFNAWAIEKKSTLPQKANSANKSPFLMFVAVLVVMMMSAITSNAQSGCTTCALGYPDNSHLPQSAVVFNESDVLKAISPGTTVCGLTALPTSIKMWYNDEHAMTLGVRKVIIKKSTGLFSTDYPVTPYTGTANNGQCATGLQFGTTIATGAQSGNDVALPNGNGRPLRPVLYLTDLTVNGANSRAGDWQQGGTGYNPTSICGSWKGAVKTVDSTRNPVTIDVTPDVDPAKNNWNIGGGEQPPAGTDNEGYGALVQWDVASLGLIPGHVYRVLVMVHDGDQNKNGGDAGEMCTTLVIAPSLYPDYNVTYVNVPVPGNVSTNDIIPPGTTYGSTPSLTSSPAGSHPSISMNGDGTYSFVSDKVGVYIYKVTVCTPGQAIPCPTTLLTITVLCAQCSNNPPVANTDIASTKVNTPVTLISLSNDKPGNVGGSLNPASVTVTVQPIHGTVTVDGASGNTTYTPANNYYGMDTLTYRVCEMPSGLCATALQIINIQANFIGNTTLAADDYVYTPINVAVSGNAKTNDTDPEGNAQTITPQTTTVASKGTLVLAADGSFTFTPVTGFTGPVNFPYTTTDNGVPAATAKATIYVLVSPELPSTNPDFNTTFVNVHVPGNVSTNDRVPVGSTYGTTPTLVSGPGGSTPIIVMNSDGTYDFVSDKVGLYTYDVPVCVPGAVSPCPPTKLYITVFDKTSNSNAPVAHVDVAYTKVNTPVTLKSLANDHAGSAIVSLVPSSVMVVVAAHHGATTVNAANGDITYTPNTDFTGRDTLTYTVCDNQAPPKCASADQIITVKGNNAPNSTEAADDYNIIPINTVGTGNVKINDTDPEGNAQTVTAQNTTVAGKGTLVLQSNGDYQFTPVVNFTGPVDFPYMTTDNGVPVATAKATLHILVAPVPAIPDLTPSIFNDGTTVFQESTRDNVIRIFNIGSGATSAPVIFTIPKMEPAYTITINPNEIMMDVFGGMAVKNSDWIITEQATRYVLTSKAGVVIAAGGYADIGVKVTAVGIKNSTGNLSVQIVFGTGGGETPYNNNADNNTYSTN